MFKVTGSPLLFDWSLSLSDLITYAVLIFFGFVLKRAFYEIGTFCFFFLYSLHFITLQPQTSTWDSQKHGLHTVESQ